MQNTSPAQNTCAGDGGADEEWDEHDFESFGGGGAQGFLGGGGALLQRTESEDVEEEGTSCGTELERLMGYAHAPRVSSPPRVKAAQSWHERGSARSNVLVDEATQALLKPSRSANDAKVQADHLKRQLFAAQQQQGAVSATSRLGGLWRTAAAPSRRTGRVQVSDVRRAHDANLKTLPAQQQPPGVSTLAQPSGTGSTTMALEPLMPLMAIPLHPSLTLSTRWPPRNTVPPRMQGSL